MKTTIMALTASVLAGVLLATEGMVPTASAVTWLILVGLVILALIVFEVDDRVRKSRRSHVFHRH